MSLSSIPGIPSWLVFIQTPIIASLSRLFWVPSIVEMLIFVYLDTPISITSQFNIICAPLSSIDNDMKVDPPNNVAQDFHHICSYSLAGSSFMNLLIGFIA